MNTSLRCVFCNQISFRVEYGRSLSRRYVFVQHARGCISSTPTYNRYFMNERKTCLIYSRAQFRIQAVVKDGCEQSIDCDAEGYKNQRQHAHIPEHQTCSHGVEHFNLRSRRLERSLRRVASETVSTRDRRQSSVAGAEHRPLLDLRRCQSSRPRRTRLSRRGQELYPRYARNILATRTL